MAAVVGGGLKMRVVSWNMGCGSARSRYRKHHANAWSYLLDHFSPEVVFVQEAMLSHLDEARARYSVRICDVDEQTDAATAVLVRADLEVEDGPIVPLGRPSYVATARIRTPDGSLDLVCVHVFPGNQQHEDLARLVEVAGHSLSMRATVLGGDFNAARKFGRRHVAFFDAMREQGRMYDAHWGMHGREGWSFWGHQAKEQYQDDHFFVSPALTARVVACEIVDDEVVRRVSDHGPVLLTLDVVAS